MSQQGNEISRHSTRADAEISRGHYDDARQTLEILMTVGQESSAWPETWLKLAYCYAMLGDAEKGQKLLDEFGGRIRGLSPRHFALGYAFISTVVLQDPQHLRMAAERFSQQFANYATSEYPGLFTRLEESIRGAVAPGTAPHDYVNTSFVLWTRGLKGLAAGEFQSALDDLVASIGRYEMGKMQGDVLWSWFDAITAFMLLDRLEDAKSLYNRYRISASTTRFGELVATMFTAYQEGSARSVIQAQHLLSQNWPDYKETAYPQIFQRFEAHIRARSESGKTNQILDIFTAGTPIALVPSDDEGIGVLRATSPLNILEVSSPAVGYRYLIARPTIEDPEEIQALVRIAELVNMGNTRPKNVTEHIRTSSATLTGRAAWDEGMVFLTTEYYSGEGKPVQLVGSCKIQYMIDACWKKETYTKIADRSIICHTDVLVFSSERSEAVELAGNSVLPEFHHQKIGKFQIQARLLFVLLYGIGHYKYIMANLLTQSDEQGTYPFFEHIVKPFLGMTHGSQNEDYVGEPCGRQTGTRSYTYDEADHLRYHELTKLNQLLGATASHAPYQFPIHVLPSEIQARFATVKSDTQRVQSVIERYGFTMENKFDFLDGGQYFSSSIEKLRRTTKPYTIEICSEPRRWMPESSIYLTFTPSKRPMDRFVCARSRAQIDGEVLLLPEEVAQRLRLQEREEVLVLRDPQTRA